MDRTGNWPQIVSYLGSGASILVGSVVLAGWAFDVPALTGVLPGQVSMKADTALAIVLLGASVWLFRGALSSSPGPRISQSGDTHGNAKGSP